MCEIVLHSKKKYSLFIKCVSLFGLLFLFSFIGNTQQTDYKYWLDSLQHYYNSTSYFTKEKSKPFPFNLLNDSIKPISSFIENNDAKQSDTFLKFNAATCGDTSIRITFTNNINNLENLYPGFITRTLDNNIIIPGGLIDDFNVGLQNFQLVKCSSTGKIIWQVKSIYKSNANYYLYRAFEAKDGSIYTAGNYEKADAFGNILYTTLLIVKFNAAGSLVWQKTNSSPLWSSPNYAGSVNISDISEGADGFLYFTGSINVPGAAKGLILKIDNSGTVKWSKSLGESNNMCTAFGINFDNVGNILLI